MSTSTPQLPPIAASTVLTPLITRITGGNPGKFTLQGTNTYLLGRGSSRLLLDTGQGFPIWASTLSSLLSTQATKVSAVILTHHHIDHIAGLPDLPLAQGQTRNDVAVYRYPAIPRREGDRTILNDVLERWAGAPVRELTDGMEIDVPGAQGWVVRTVFTPGHTTDHCAFLLKRRTTAGGGAGVGAGIDVALADQEEISHDPILFTGDAVLGHGTAVFEDLAAYMASLQKMLGVVEDAEKKASTTIQAYPAHGEVIANAAAKLQEYIAHRAQREREVSDVLRGNQSLATSSSTGITTTGSDKHGSERQPMQAMDIVKVVYKDYPESLHLPAEGGVKLILRKLVADGVVSGDESGGWVWTGSADPTENRRGNADGENSSL